MKIKYADDGWSWVCPCGNKAASDGFYPCNSEGEVVDPTPQEWTTNLYVCSRCGKMIDCNTLEVKGQAFLINGQVQNAS